MSEKYKDLFKQPEAKPANYVEKASGNKKNKQGKRKRGRMENPLPQVPQGQLFDPAALQKEISQNQQEILQTPAAKQRNKDAQDPFKNGFFKTNEQRREVEKKYSSVPNLRIDKNQEPAPGQTPAQKLFAPATPPQQQVSQQNDPKATAEYRARMAKHRQTNITQAPAPQQRQKSFNQGALTDQEYADMEAKAAMAKNRVDAIPRPDPSRYQKALAAASGAQDTAGNQSGNDIKTNIFGGMLGFEGGQASSQAAGQSMDELAQAAADWERQNAEFDSKTGVSALPKVANQPAQIAPAPPRKVLPDMNQLKNLAAQEQLDRASSPWQDFKDAAIDKTASFLYGAGQISDNLSNWTNSLFNANAIQQGDLPTNAINPPAVRALKKAQYDQYRFNLPQPQPADQVYQPESYVDDFSNKTPVAQAQPQQSNSDPNFWQQFAGVPAIPVNRDSFKDSHPTSLRSHPISIRGQQFNSPDFKARLMADQAQLLQGLPFNRRAPKPDQFVNQF